MFKVALAVFCLLLLPYLMFALPQRVQQRRAAKQRFILFLAAVSIFIFILFKVIR